MGVSGHKVKSEELLAVNFCIYQHLFLFLFFCNAFHFYQPARSAYSCLYDDMWYLRVKLIHQMLYGMIIRDVAQIDDKVSDIVHGGIAIL